MGGRGEEAAVEAEEAEEEVAERGLAGERTAGEDGREEDVDCSCEGRLERAAGGGCEVEAGGLLATLAAVLDLSFF